MFKKKRKASKHEHVLGFMPGTLEVHSASGRRDKELIPTVLPVWGE